MKITFVLTLSLYLVLPVLTFSQERNCDEANRIIYEANRKLSTQEGYLQRIQLYKEAISICPKSEYAHNNLADTYERQGRFEEAISEYRKAIEINGEFSTSYFSLGDIYLKTNRQEEAAKWYKKGLEIKPDDKVSRQRLEKAQFISEELREYGVITAESIKKLLASKTRTLGEIVSIQFNEDMIAFDYDKAELKPAAVPQLQQIGIALRDILGTRDIQVEGLGNTVIQISGHTDSRGTDSYNNDLSRKRAATVVSYLTNEYSIPSDRIIAEGYGEGMPLCTVETEACHALNRRVEIAKLPNPHSTRSLNSTEDSELAYELGVFYKKSGHKGINTIYTDNVQLENNDKIFLFFRPAQDSFVYILNEDSDSNFTLIYPSPGESSRVKKGRDYWVPSMGKAYTLEGASGREKIYFIATSWPLENSKGELTAKLLHDAVKSLKSQPTRAILPVASGSDITTADDSSSPESISETESGEYAHNESVQQNAEQIITDFGPYLMSIEGNGGWVKTVEFVHK